MLILLVVPGLWLVRHLLLGKLLPSTPLDLPILGLAIMVLVSLSVTTDFLWSLPKIGGIVWGIGFFYATVSAVNTSRINLQLGVGLFLLMGVGVSALGLLGTDWDYDSSLLYSITSNWPQLISGFQGAEGGFNPNEIAGTLLWFLPLGLTIYVGGIFQSKLKRLVKLFIFLGMLIVLTTELVLVVLTESRGALFGLGITLVGMMVLWSKAGRVLALLGGVSALVLAFFIPGKPLNQAAVLVAPLFAGRLQHWERALIGINMFPLTGMGMNMYRRLIHVFYPIFMVSHNREIPHAHNEYLQAALDLGIPGLIAFLALNLGAIWMVIRVWRGPQVMEGQKAIALGLGGGLVAHMIFGITDAIALGAKPGIFYWMLLGVIAGLHQHVTSLK